MFDLLYVRSIREPEEETARHPAGDGDFGDQGAREAADHHDSSPRNDLAVFGLVDVGAEGPPSLYSSSDLPARDTLGVFGLVGAGGPAGQQSLDTASPRDLLKLLGLLA
jgi:hypothetical protein